MLVSQVAYDRFVVELPAADATWRPLADRAVLAETSAWLWDFGPTPLVAVVGYDDALPEWLLDGWTGRRVPVTPGGAPNAVALAIDDRAALERFLASGAPHARTMLLWPRTSIAKTLEALATGGEAWRASVDAFAHVERGGEVVEVTQVHPR